MINEEILNLFPEESYRTFLARVNTLREVIDKYNRIADDPATDPKFLDLLYSQIDELTKERGEAAELFFSEHPNWWRELTAKQLIHPWIETLLSESELVFENQLMREINETLSKDYLIRLVFKPLTGRYDDGSKFKFHEASYEAFLPVRSKEPSEEELELLRKSFELIASTSTLDSEAQREEFVRLRVEEVLEAHKHARMERRKPNTAKRARNKNRKNNARKKR